ncbi:hypothetical protein UFOVP9_45 [uncultured Caudovirales phage]|jgi:hypothetical protein|uniref:Uncharacterized protein n=1 Tax=uncultured Caudovirales phage TaxID=2100421 RepID=A0A6J5KIS2_9CAUD|nr:hypothetical protein UFOVP9_45 [uncultured Caudovirales phage]
MRKKYKELYNTALDDLRYSQNQLLIAKDTLIHIEKIMNYKIEDSYEYVIIPRITNDCWHPYSEICICFITNRVYKSVINRMKKCPRCPIATEIHTKPEIQCKEYMDQLKDWIKCCNPDFGCPYCLCKSCWDDGKMPECSKIKDKPHVNNELLCKHCIKDIKGICFSDYWKHLVATREIKHEKLEDPEYKQKMSLEAFYNWNNKFNIGM